MNIVDISKQFKDLADLQKFAEAQQKLILNLSRQVAQLETERDHLKKLIETGVPLITSAPKLVESSLKDPNDAEAICIMQLKLLRDMSLVRELTLEECRKTEIYTKVLSSLKQPKEKDKDIGKDLSDADLLEMADKK